MSFESNSNYTLYFIPNKNSSIDLFDNETTYNTSFEIISLSKENQVNINANFINCSFNLTDSTLFFNSTNASTINTLTLQNSEIIKMTNLTVIEEVNVFGDMPRFENIIMTCGHTILNLKGKYQKFIFTNSSLEVGSMNITKRYKEININTNSIFLLFSSKLKNNQIPFHFPRFYCEKSPVIQFKGWTDTKYNNTIQIHGNPLYIFQNYSKKTFEIKNKPTFIPFDNEFYIRCQMV